MYSLRFLFIALTLVMWTVPRSGWGQVNNAQIKTSIERAAAYLRKSVAASGDSGSASIAAYAMIKAGDDPESAAVQKVVAGVAKRANSSNYVPGSDGIYGAGVELMLLEAAGGKKYRKEMEAIVAYLVHHQNPSGAWDYVGAYEGGDTSQCQYAMLGFWAAERAGIKVNRAVWDRGAKWFLQTQGREGGFCYHPNKKNAEDLEITHSMTAAGVCSVMLARMHLYPNDDGPGQSSAPKKKTAKFGVLEEVDLDTVEKPDGTKEVNPDDYKPSVASSALLGSASRANGWLGRRFTVSGTRWVMYYLYTLERAAALMNVNQIGGHDWYREGATYLVRSQAKDGSWKSVSGQVPCTAFGILFLTRATAKALGHHVPLDPLGNGMLAGGRGLPDDLNKAVLKDGKVETEKDLGPIDQLLAELEKVESVDVAAAQKAIVEQVTLGDREELIKQKERLVKLAKHPNVEVRRTAIWALGRTEDLNKAKLLIDALDDNDVDVMVEARNALCILSRKPLGFGLPESPFDKLPESATPDQKQEAVKQWRKKLKDNWEKWYYKYRPYQERDDLSEALFKGK
ncbi:MAG: hypothetical protein KDA84_20670 [Planctomycetaceae bacterium]|nr:hypothetical protein [Planctomycetaceae bacterium]